MNVETNVHQKVQEQFGKNAEKYVTSAGHSQGSDLRRLVDWLRPTGQEVALDIATGGGHVAKALSPHTKLVYVTDLTPRMLMTARAHLSEAAIDNVVYVCADAEALPFLDDSFDIVTCRIAPHHFAHPERFVTEVARVLKPGGQFVLIDNVSPEATNLANFVNLVEQIRDPSHVRCLAVSEWSNLLTEAGLSTVTSEIGKKVFAFDAWVHRMAPTEAHQGAAEATLRLAPKDAAEYFEVNIDGDHVQSWSIDQWMVLARKSERF